VPLRRESFRRSSILALVVVLAASAGQVLSARLPARALVSEAVVIGFTTVYAAVIRHLALDDVGEGHSTLEVLATAMPEFIKLAGSLVAHSSQPGPRGAIQAAVAFARSTGATVIAEGIENRGIGIWMADLGVELGQGYWLGEPSLRQPTFPGSVRAPAPAVLPAHTLSC
jgi:EAL domain-containing protein (putative c-di-GMP-specific phosphodiesterase class I)